MHHFLLNEEEVSSSNCILIGFEREIKNSLFRYLFQHILLSIGIPSVVMVDVTKFLSNLE